MANVCALGRGLFAFICCLGYLAAPVGGGNFLTDSLRFFMDIHIGHQIQADLKTDHFQKYKQTRSKW